MNYFIDLPGFENREVSHQECLDLLASGKLALETFVCPVGSISWYHARTYFQCVAAAPLPGSPMPAAPAQSPSTSPLPGTYLKYWLFLLAAISAIVGLVLLLGYQHFTGFGSCLAAAFSLAWLGCVLDLLQAILTQLKRLVKLAQRKD